jgi:hypothetical protein
MKIESRLLLFLFLILLGASFPAYLHGSEPWIAVSIMTYVLALPGSLLVALITLSLSWIVSVLGLGCDLFPIAEFIFSWILCMLVAQCQVRIVRRFRDNLRKGF